MNCTQGFLVHMIESPRKSAFFSFKKCFFLFKKCFFCFFFLKIAVRGLYHCFQQVQVSQRNAKDTFAMLLFARVTRTTSQFSPRIGETKCLSHSFYPILLELVTTPCVRDSGSVRATTKTDGRRAGRVRRWRTVRRWGHTQHTRENTRFVLKLLGHNSVFLGGLGHTGHVVAS